MPIEHGIKILEPVTGARPITLVATAVIGLIATASDADAVTFPLDKPVLVTDVRSAIAKAGEEGTLARALTEISNQCSPIIVVVRVAPGVADEDMTAEEATSANVVGDFTGAGYTGMQALLAAEAQLGMRPRILGAPGLDTQEVAVALEIVAKKLRGFAYTSCWGADTVAEAVTYRGEFSAREHMLIYPDFTGWPGKAVAIALGARAAIDQQVGWHKTLSNYALAGVTGLTADIDFDIRSSSNAAGLLNAAPVTTLVHMNGYRFWGNRTTSDEPLFAFESAVRTAQALQDSIADGLIWAVDKPLTVGLIRDIEETINASFRLLQAQGRIIGGSAWFDPALNTAVSLAAGQLTIDYDFTPCAPAELITLNQRITDRYYVGFADQV